MNLALSNFAFDNFELLKIHKILKDNNIYQRETVLTKIDDWDKLDDSKILIYNSQLAGYGLAPYSIQSLFYNVNCKDITDTDIIIEHFERLIKYAEILGSKILVFGSPGLRKKNEGWQESLIKVFKYVDNLLENSDIKIVIEPNAKYYGGEFFNNIYEIVEFIQSNNLNSIKTMIDTHNSLLEKGNRMKELRENFNYIEHIHISEPGLGIINDDEFHLLFSRELKLLGYNKTVTYEVNKWDKVIESLKTFAEIYF